MDKRAPVGGGAVVGVEEQQIDRLVNTEIVHDQEAHEIGIVGDSRDRSFGWPGAIN